MAKRSQKRLAPIIIALILDILAFTIILPLFPRLIAGFHRKWLAGEDKVYGYSLDLITVWRKWITFIPDNSSYTHGRHHPRDLDIVLMGGALGSLFSLLQFLSSPLIGRLSDKWGRKPVLILTMFGNIAAAMLWIFADSFWVFLVSRVVGGLSEGNVQLSIAMITDITDHQSRSRALAMVGIAFALGFTFGPAIGAYTSTVDLTTVFPSLSNIHGVNQFSTTAALCLLLLVVETIYICLFVYETIPSRSQSVASTRQSDSNSTTTALRPRSPVATVITRRMAKATTSRSNDEGKNEVKHDEPIKELIETHRKALSHRKNRRILMLTNGVFLFFFSGMEFTLTFLTYERFQFTNMQQGKLLGFIGILSSLIQGGYVRRFVHRLGEARIVAQGLFAASLASVVLAFVGTNNDLFGNKDYSLVVAGSLFAFSSGTVANLTTALYSMAVEAGSESQIAVKPADARKLDDLGHNGEMMGYLRSVGQLGRALGPIAFCSLYWLTSGMISYCVAAAGILVLYSIFRLQLNV